MNALYSFRVQWPNFSSTASASSAASAADGALSFQGGSRSPLACAGWAARPRLAALHLAHHRLVLLLVVVAALLRSRCGRLMNGSAGIAAAARRLAVLVDGLLRRRTDREVEQVLLRRLEPLALGGRLGAALQDGVEVLLGRARVRPLEDGVGAEADHAEQLLLAEAALLLGEPPLLDHESR